MSASTPSSWTREHIAEIYHAPLLDLVFRAATVHRTHHASDEVQCASLLSIKTGSCAEDCSYCSQSAHYETDLESEKLLDTSAVVQAAQQAQANGADRFCMGAAWRGLRDNHQFEQIKEMVTEVKALGLETCLTAGLLEPHHADELKTAGLDYYNHNLDTSREYYPEIVTTRDYDDRLRTLASVRDSGIKVCCGGILGLGESEEDRIGLLFELANLQQAPESVPINALVPIPGTPFESNDILPWDQMVRAVATARIIMPQSAVRLSAGRMEMTEEAQAMCFLAGANSIFLGDRLLTTANNDEHADAALFRKLGLKPLEVLEPERISV
ncbi:MAG: biotin synthase BioB [Planctomycetes bacterium]|nr:biotin synthase BioB [Planctomycetota bacterium]